MFVFLGHSVRKFLQYILVNVNDYIFLNIHFQPFWKKLHDFYETNESYLENPMPTANKMKRNGNMITVTKTKNDKKIVTRPDEEEELKKQLYYDLFV